MSDEAASQDYTLRSLAKAVENAVSDRVYQSDQRLVDRRITDVEHDVKDLATKLDTHERDHARDDHEALNRKSADWRQFLYAGIVPFAVGVLVAVFTAAWKG